MVEIYFIPEVVEARPKSSMHHFCIHVGFLIVSRAPCTLCMLYIVLAHADVHALSLLNVHKIQDPFLHSFVGILPN
jgi:hypothetical protein